MRILVAYDGSEWAAAALEDLKRAGLDLDAEALVMSVADIILPDPVVEEGDNGAPLYVPESVKRAHERAQHKLDQAAVLAGRASEQIKTLFPSWRVSYRAEADSPAWAVIRKADEWKPDLIVMGARGHSVFGGRLILGSISQRVLYEARCSVRIGRGPRKNTGRPIRILIGVDTSSDSRAAVEAVCDRNWPGELHFARPLAAAGRGCRPEDRAPGMRGPPGAPRWPWRPARAARRARRGARACSRSPSAGLWSGSPQQISASRRPRSPRASSVSCGVDGTNRDRLRASDAGKLDRRVHPRAGPRDGRSEGRGPA